MSYPADSAPLPDAAGDSSTDVLSCLTASELQGRIELFSLYHNQVTERCVEDSKARGVAPPTRPSAARAYAGYYPEECEAYSLCRRDPVKIDAWRQMARQYQPLLAGGEAFTPGPEHCGETPFNAFLPVADEDLRRDILTLYQHPAMTPYRQQRLLGAHVYYTQRALMSRIPTLTEKQAGDISQTWLYTGDIARTLATAPAAARTTLNGFFDGFRHEGASPTAVEARPGASVSARATTPLSHADTGVVAERVVLQYSPQSAAMIRAFLRDRVPGQAADVIVAGRRELDAVRALATGEWGLKPEQLRNVRFLTCADGDCPRGLSAWSRDHYLLVSTPEGGRLLRARETSGHMLASQGIFDEIYRGLFSRTSEISFQGGQIVTGPTWTFISDEVRAINARYSREEIETIFARETGRRAMLVPSLRSWPHIDLYLTPVGGNTVLVGDTAAGVRMLLEWTALSPANQNQAVSVLGNGSFSRMQEALRQSRDDAPKLEELVIRLTQAGLTVERVPLLTGRCCNVSPIVTYNNVFQSGTAVYVGQYDLPPLDAAGLATYRSRGMTPIPLPATDLARHGGAIHCAINALPGDISTSADPIAADIDDLSAYARATKHR